jgi:mycofactocin system glycosyltransferase
LRLALDPDTRRIDGGRVLVGGSPLRILRLTAAGAVAVEGLVAGDSVGPAPTRQWLARRLLDSGLAQPRPPAVLAEAPRVAIVIPVRDRPAGLASTLAALAATTGDRRAPIVVVDDGSVGPGTADIARAAGARVVRHERHRGPAAARNSGWRSTDADVVAFVDADCVPSEGWLDALLPHFVDASVAAVAPRIAPAAPLGARRWLFAYERVRSPLDRGSREGAVRPRSRIPFVPAATLLVRRRVLEEVGGFDEDLVVGEDVDLVWRLAGTGWTVRYEPAATVAHPIRPDTVAWLRQRFDYGTSAAALGVRHGRAVAPLTVSLWSAAAWGLGAVRRPVTGLGVAPATTALLARRLGALDHPWREATELAGRGHLGAGRLIADAARRAWWPLAIPVALGSRRARPAVAAAFVVPPLVDWARQRPPLDPVRWAAASVADDLAYGAGVWAGVVRTRSPTALVPDLASWPGRRPAVES